MKIAVLGSGPAGLMVAHACARKEVDFDIISDSLSPSRMGGAQYLHIPIPGLTEDEPEGQILVSKRGTPAGYASKVGRTGHETSWSKFEEGPLGVWNLSEAYKRLWTMYGGANILPGQVEGRYLPEFYEIYDVILSTIPKKALCEHPFHTFAEQRVWINSGSDLGVPLDCMIYDGTEQNYWYRASHIFGHQSKEYPMQWSGARQVVKPLWTDCDCHPEVFCFGRYGRWEKRWLTSDAYTGASEAVGVLTNLC
jgi:hypothetical protein